jgi:hypothetical protein
VTVRLRPRLGLAVMALWGTAALAQDVQFPPPPPRPEMPRPEWAPPDRGPMNAGLPGAEMPGADPFQLLENSKQVQAELGLTPHQLSNLHLAAVHVQDRLVELSQPRPGESKDQMRAEIQHQLHETNMMIERELTAQQRNRFQQIMLQLQGPCMAIMDPEIARQIGISPDQGQTLAGACAKKSEQMRSAFKPPAPGEDFCAAIAANQGRIEQIKARADEAITAQLQPPQQVALNRMMGPKINLEPPIPPNCRH